jgi:transposase
LLIAEIDIDISSQREARMHIQPSLRERQVDWFEGMEGAFLRFGGVPAEVLVDNAKALVEHHDAATRAMRFNARLHPFARYWSFSPRACAPYRARTSGENLFRVLLVTVAPSHI